MKLSIHIIFDKLVIPDTRLIACSRPQNNLSGVRLLHDDSDLTKEVVYLANPGQLTDFHSPMALSFICLGKIDEALIPRHWTVIIMAAQPDSIIIFEKVQAIFDTYRSWNDRINEAIFAGDTLQSIMDAACDHLKNPAALFDDSQGLLMHTSHMNPEKIDAIWKHVLDKGYSLKEVDSITLNEKFKSQRHPFYYQSPDSFGSIKRLIAPIIVNGKLFGSLAMTELTSPFTDSEFCNMCIAQQIMENALSVNDEFSRNQETPWYLYRLLNNNFVDANILSHHLALKGRKIKDTYRLWCFVPSNPIDNLNSPIKQLTKLFKKGLVFSYHSAILVCDYATDAKSGHLTVSINDFLSRNEFQATSSMIYGNLFDLNLAYSQCQISMEFLNDSVLETTCFANIYSDYVLSILEKNTNLAILITPQLRNLDKIDPYTKELLLCLHAYIANGKNISAAATTLHIHRHTVVYRLKNIEKLTGLQYETIQDQALFQLFLSCSILLRSLAE
ncbi:helix-turn-helix domain-containing protein [Eubacteriaceae bacterium ES2]|nr:helix-turn-helix domain-containing protein [Eubacteriaceae bacterium ES2]